MCASIAEVVGRHEAKVRVRKDNRSEDAASIPGLMTLDAAKGTKLTLSATGPEAEKVVLALVDPLSAGSQELSDVRMSGGPWD